MRWRVNVCRSVCVRVDRWQRLETGLPVGYRHVLGTKDRPSDIANDADLRMRAVRLATGN